MLQTFCRTICPNTVLLFEDRMKHPALRVIVVNYLSLLTCVRARKLKKHPKIWIVELFTLITLFFQIEQLFHKVRRERQRQAERQRKTCLHWLLFLCTLIENLIQTWNFRFLKNYQIWSFFRPKCETFFRIFNLDKAYRHTIPFAWHVFR